MKKILIYIYFFSFYTCAAQFQYVSNIDTLRYRFRSQEPYEVMHYFLQNVRRFPTAANKPLYYDEEMKAYFMRWFEPDQIINCYKEEQLRKINNLGRSKEKFIKNKIESIFHVNPDSVARNPNLWKLYSDSVINITLERKLRDSKINTSRPDDCILITLSNLAYPEVYKKIKDLWYSEGKTVIKADHIDNILYCLLIMNDPEAQAAYKMVIDEFIESSGEKDKFVNSLNCLDALTNPYSIRRMVDLLIVQKSYNTGDHGEQIPFDWNIYACIHSLLELYKIPTTQLFGNGSLVDLATCRKNKAQIIKLAEELIKKMEAEEKYWMDNMPFDYVPDGTFHP